MKKILLVCGVLIAVSTGGAILYKNFQRSTPVFRAVEELKVRITSTVQLPDPARIESSGDWYFLDHVSSSLAAYDNRMRKFFPMLAESWSTRPDGAHLFQLRPGIRFHDGTPITTKDILWSIKRQLLLKTSTHFPLWEYIVGCENIKTLEDNCEGLQAPSEHEIAIKLKVQTNSFFLQMASPETGIWAASNMDPATAALHPTKFSGPYYLHSGNDAEALMKRNEHSPISAVFPDSPRAIRLKKIPLSEMDGALVRGEIDFAIRQHTPLAERNWKQDGIVATPTTPSIMIYFYGLGKTERKPVGKDFVDAAWKLNLDSYLSAADTYLPFSSTYGLTREEFKSELPNQTAKKLKLLCLDGLFPKAFLDQLQNAAKIIGSEIEYIFVSREQWFAAFDDPTAGSKYDYILSAYAASERYPAVQLRYITMKLMTPPIDLKQAESADLTKEKITILKDYQKWLLRVRQAIPIYFNVMLFLHRKALDIGEQSTSDAEIELWRVRERSGT